MRCINSCDYLVGARRRLKGVGDAKIPRSATDPQEMVILRITRVRCWKPQMMIDPCEKVMSGHVVRKNSDRSIIGMICRAVCDD